MEEYLANAGQTYIPFQENTNVDILPYEKLNGPTPPLPELGLNHMAGEKR